MGTKLSEHDFIQWISGYAAAYKAIGQYINPEDVLAKIEDLYTSPAPAIPLGPIPRTDVYGPAIMPPVFLPPKERHPWPNTNPDWNTVWCSGVSKGTLFNGKEFTEGNTVIRKSI